MAISPMFMIYFSVGVFVIAFMLFLAWIVVGAYLEQNPAGGMNA